MIDVSNSLAQLQNSQVSSVPTVSSYPSELQPCLDGIQQLLALLKTFDPSNPNQLPQLCNDIQYLISQASVLSNSKDLGVQQFVGFLNTILNMSFGSCPYTLEEAAQAYSPTNPNTSEMQSLMQNMLTSGNSFSSFETVLQNLINDPIDPPWPS